MTAVPLRGESRISDFIENPAVSGVQEKERTFGTKGVMMLCHLSSVKGRVGTREFSNHTFLLLLVVVLARECQPLLLECDKVESCG